MEVVTVTPQRVSKRVPRTPGGTPAAIGGAVLAAALLGGCGAAADHAQQLPRQAALPEATTEQPPVAPAPEASPAPAPPAENSTAEDSGTTSAARPATRDASPRVERCHTSMLSGSLTRAEPGAGQRYAELVLTNRSGQTCTLYGYGGLQLVGADGTPLPTNTERTPNPGPQLVRLDPGDAASATLHWTAMPHQGEPAEGPCQPRPSSVQVIPPDETDALSVPWDEGPVCGWGAIDNSAYHS